MGGNSDGGPPISETTPGQAELAVDGRVITRVVGQLDALVQRHDSLSDLVVRASAAGTLPEAMAATRQVAAALGRALRTEDATARAMEVTAQALQDLVTNTHAVDDDVTRAARAAGVDPAPTGWPTVATGKKAV